jgi:hypothetical protein
MHVAMFGFSRFNVMLMFVMPFYALILVNNNLEMFSKHFGSMVCIQKFPQIWIFNKSSNNKDRA